MAKIDQENDRITRSIKQILAETKEEPLSIFESVLSSISDFVYLFDKKGRFVYSNKAFLNLLEIDHTEIIGKTFLDLPSYPRELAERLQQQIQQVLESKKTIRDENPYKAPLKAERDYEYIFNPVISSGGTVELVAALARDITEKKEVKEKLHQANERLEERMTTMLSYQNQLRSLASQLSKAEERERRRLGTELHDNLGQLLAVCKMQIEDLSREDKPHDQRSIDNLKDLMDKAIKYARNLMAELKPPPSINKGNFEDLVNWVAKKMERYNLDVTIENVGRPKPLNEEIQTILMQCVREVLFNVVKHANVKQANVTLAESDEQVQVTVEDRGKGFNPNEMKQASTTVEDNHFGLFNINERMDLLGGDMEIQSEPEKGTKITLYAPLESKVKSQKSKVKSQKAKGKRQKAKGKRQKAKKRKLRFCLQMIMKWYARDCERLLIKKMI
jgi:PAS domain S-box-containing protein